MNTGVACAAVHQFIAVQARYKTPIIAVQGEGPPDDLDDGLVQYKSAHLEHAESEFVVRSFHSCQDNPNTIGEVRRILLEHLRAIEKSHP